MRKSADHRYDLGSRIAFGRKTAGLSQRQVAELLGIPTRTFSYYESPDGDLPSSLLVPLAEIFEMDVRELLGAQPQADVCRRPGRSQLAKKAEAIRKLPQGDRRFVLKFLDQVLEDHARRRGRNRKTAADS